MKLVFLATATASVIFAVLGTQFAVDIADRGLSAIANEFGLHEAPAHSSLAVLGIPFLYLVFRKTRRPWFKKGRCVRICL